MDNRIGGHAGQVPGAASAAPSGGLNNDRGSAPAHAASTIATAIAVHLPRELTLKCLDLIISTMPETVPQVLEIFKDEMAPQHGFSRLYQVLDSGNLNNLPTVDALTLDLQKFYQIDSSTDKRFIYKTLESISSHIPDLLSAENVDTALANRLAETSQVLFQTIGPDYGQAVSPDEQLTLNCLTQLSKLFALVVNPEEQATPMAKTRDFLTVEQADLSEAIQTVSIARGALNFQPLEYRNNREVVTAAINLNGQALQFASEALKNDIPIVLAAVRKSGLAGKHAGVGPQNNLEVAKAAVEGTVFALDWLSPDMRNHPDVTQLVFRERSLPPYSYFSNLYGQNTHEIVGRHGAERFITGWPDSV